MDEAAIRKAAEKVKTFPFAAYLSFLPIIKHWESLEKHGSSEEKGVRRLYT